MDQVSDWILRITVHDGLDGVNRVVGLLRHRGTRPRSITAWVTNKPNLWLLEHQLTASEDQAELLHKQLERLTCVVTVARKRTADPRGAFTRWE